MFPNLVILYPGIAKSLLDYRYVRIGAAKERARLRGYNGAMWPWESALIGFGVAAWHKGDEHEIHIGGDIVHASRSYMGSWRLRGHMQPSTSLYVALRSI